MVSNGAYVVSRWTPKQRLKLRRNPAYWGVAEVRTKTIDVIVEEDEVRQADAFRAGKVDWLPFVSDIAASNAAGPLKSLYTRPMPVSYFLRVNCTRAPFSDPRVRRALALSIDRSAVAAHAGPIPRTALDHVVPMGLAGYLPPESRMSHDPAEARRLLAEAGFPGGKGFPEIDYVVNVNEGHFRIAEALEKMLDKTLGIRLRVRKAEWADFETGTRRREYDLARAGWVLDYPDPQSALEMWTAGSPDNRTGWSDARYDRWVRYAADVFALLDAFAGVVEELLGLGARPRESAVEDRKRCGSPRTVSGRPRPRPCAWNSCAKPRRSSCRRRSRSFRCSSTWPTGLSSPLWRASTFRSSDRTARASPTSRVSTRSATCPCGADAPQRALAFRAPPGAASSRARRSTSMRSGVSRKP